MRALDLLYLSALAILDLDSRVLRRYGTQETNTLIFPAKRIHHSQDQDQFILVGNNFFVLRHFHKSQAKDTLESATISALPFILELRSLPLNQHCIQRVIMLASTTTARRKVADILVRNHQSAAVRSLSTKATPIGSDGRHEIWREGIYDHDNEPK